jgi:hypothetical protein
VNKILIISYLFAPENSIGAVRPTKLAKYLNKNKYLVDVVTTSFKGNLKSPITDDIKELNLVRLEHSKYFLKINNKINDKVNTKSLNDKTTKINVEVSNYPVKRPKIRKYFSFLIRQLIALFRAFDYFFVFKKHVNNNIEKYKEYNVCFSTYGPIASVLCGLWFKKKFPEIKWICDFRDPLVVEDTPSLLRGFYSHIQNSACKIADVIVAVSSGYLDRIARGEFKEKSLVITNGYDADDLPNLSNVQPSSKFTFVYPGSLYEGKRKLIQLFKVISELYKEGEIDINDIEFWYAGSEFPFLYEQALQFNVESTLVNLGSLDRNTCLQLQQKARILVLSTWNNSSEEGVLPGKIFEYMLFKKPIIALISGNKENSEVFSLITNARIGVACEEIQAEHYNLLKQFVNNEYKRYKNNLEPNYVPNIEILDNYNYENITKQIIGTLENSFYWKRYDQN